MCSDLFFKKKEAGQHFSSQDKAARLSGPACTWHRSAQALQLVYLGVMTSVQLPPPVSQRAYCRHRSPIWYSMVQTCGAEIPHVRSAPWQVVNPQYDRGVSAVTTAGVGGGSGVGVAVAPGNTEVQPAEKRTAASTTRNMPEMKCCFFMEYRVSCDIRPGAIYWFILLRKFWESARGTRKVVPATCVAWRDPRSGTISHAGLGQHG